MKIQTVLFTTTILVFLELTSFFGFGSAYGINKSDIYQNQKAIIQGTLIEKKNQDMATSLNAIKAIPMELRIESNKEFTNLMNIYNISREIWLIDNAELIKKGLIVDIGKAKYTNLPNESSSKPIGFIISNEMLFVLIFCLAYGSFVFLEMSFKTFLKKKK